MFERSQHYKLLYTISNNIEVFEEPVPWTNETSDRAVKFEVDEEIRIVYKRLY